MPDRASFGADTTADEVLEGIDLTGRTAVVTGASGGLGAEAARALAAAGVSVTLTARDIPKGEKVASAIRERHPGADVEVRELELMEPESVRRFAKDWLADRDPLARLDILLLNAGLMACPLARTAEGWESQLATNHVGHFLLANLLLPAVLRAAPARVVVLSSGGHKISPVVFDDLHFERREYEPWSAYGQAKTANVLFAVELDRRLRDRGVRAFAVHPGTIGTELGRHLTKETISRIRKQASGAGEAMKSLEAGAATEVWAATAPELDGQGGLYLANCGIGSTDQEGPRGVAPHALDPDAAKRLWTATEALLGERFDP